jgi:hypothetical protein
VDRGVVSLDTDMQRKYGPLDAAASWIFTGLDDSGPLSLVENTHPVTPRVDA